MSERDNLEKTLKMARRVLTMLEQQAAGHTSLSMPAELMIRLEDKRSEVAELEARLEALSSPVSSPNIGPPLSQSTGISASERKYLRQYLTSRFSLGELKTLAFDLGLDYEAMPHQTKADFPQALIAYCERLGPQTLKELLQAGLELRSDEGVGEILTQLISSTPSPPLQSYSIEPAISLLPMIPVQLIINGTIQDFNSERRTILLNTIAAILELKPSEIRVFKVEAGSVRLTLEIPETALERLFTLSPENFEPLVNLGVQYIRGQNSTGKPVELVFRQSGAENNSINLEKIQSDRAIIGNYGDAMDAEQAARLGLSVCLVEAPGYGGEIGTGFLIAPRLVLTNYHVVTHVKAIGDLNKQAAKLVCRFGYRGSGTTTKLGRSVKVDQNQPLLASSEIAKLDYALLQLAEAASDENGVPIPPLTVVADRLLGEKEPIWIVQHPQGSPQRFAQGQISRVDPTGQRFEYTTNTEPGSSGSPVFDRYWNLVGLHHSGLPLPERSTAGTGNEGIPFSSIWPEIEATVIPATSQSNPASVKPLPTIVPPDATQVERGLIVKPKGEGDVISLSEFQKGKIVIAGAFGAFFTVRLTDAVTTMWRVCQEIDSGCERVVIKPSGRDSAYFKIEYRSNIFTVISERDWDSGIRILLTTENLPQLVVTITVRASAEIAEKIIQNFKRQPGVQAIKILKEW